MRDDVNYLLDNSLRSNIVKVKNRIISEIQDVEIFLFGSIAKGCYSKKSDIDLIILLNTDKSIKELRILRHELEDSIESLNIGIEVDIKLYSNSRYKELCKKPCFEKAILDDLVDIRSW